MALRDFRVVARDVPPELTRRLALIGGLVVLVIALLISRLWYLQVIRGSAMRLTSENNRIRLTRLPAARGLVYDRFGELLVDNRPSFDVVLADYGIAKPRFLGVGVKDVVHVQIEFGAARRAG